MPSDTFDFLLLLARRKPERGVDGSESVSKGTEEPRTMPTLESRGDSRRRHLLKRVDR